MQFGALWQIAVIKVPLSKGLLWISEKATCLHQAHVYIVWVEVLRCLTAKVDALDACVRYPPTNTLNYSSVYLSTVSQIGPLDLKPFIIHRLLGGPAPVCTVLIVLYRS